MTDAAHNQHSETERSRPAPSRKGVAAAMVLVGCGHMSDPCGAVG